MTPPSDSYRVGIAGLGKIAHRHAQAIAQVTGLALASCFDHNKNTHADLQTVFPDVKAYTDFDPFLNSVDCAVICLPSFLHAEYGMRCVAAGKHFLLEKPIDTHIQPATQLAEACRKSKLVAGVVSQHRYCPVLNFCRDLIEVGALGTIQTARATVRWYRPDSYYASSSWRGREAFEPGGVLINQAVHAFDILRWWFGSAAEIKSVSNASRAAPFDAADSVLCHWKTREVLVSLEATTAAWPGFLETYAVYGSQGYVRIEGGKLIELKLDSTTPPPEPQPCSNPVERFISMYRNWVGAIQGTEPLLCDLQQGLETLEMIDMARSSANNAKGPA